MVKITHKLGKITEAEARKLAPKLFTVETLDIEESNLDQFEGDDWSFKYKKGDICIAVEGGYGEPHTFKLVKVTSVKMNFSGEDSVRIGDDKYTWRHSGILRKI